MFLQYERSRVKWSFEAFLFAPLFDVMSSLLARNAHGCLNTMRVILKDFLFLLS